MSATPDTIRRRTLQAIARQNARHTYSFEAGRYVVNEPLDAGGATVCTLAGDVDHPATHLQADAICRALDGLMRRQLALMDGEDAE